MNWLLPVTAAVLLLCAWDGHRKGFIKKLVGAVSWVLVLWLSSFLSPIVGVLIPDYEALAFLTTLILVGVLVKGVVFALDIVAKLPILNGLNRLAGTILGFAEGMLLIWIFFLAVSVFAATQWGGTLMEMISKSALLTWIYENNMLFSLMT